MTAKKTTPKATEEKVAEENIEKPAEPAEQAEEQ